MFTAGRHKAKRTKDITFPIRLILLAVLFSLLASAPFAFAGNWTVARSSHFEVYSQAGGDSAARALKWFEQMRAVVESQTAIPLPSRQPIRVIGFASEAAFRSLRPSDTTDAFYTGTEARDYIVMPSLEPERFGMAAHEYAHAVVRGARVQLPVWLGEGLAEMASSLQILAKGTSYGGSLARHSRALQQSPMSVEDLFAVTADTLRTGGRDYASRVYAHSWALTRMLALSPDYQAGFEELIRSIASGVSSREAFERTYRKSASTLDSQWRKYNSSGLDLVRLLPAASASTPNIDVETISPARFELMAAEILFGVGKLERAESTYRAATVDTEVAGEAFAGLGTLALQRKDHDAAREALKKAMDLGVRDAVLCYRFAVLAQESEQSYEEARPALLRALSIDPAFDDARFNLALIEAGQSRFESAITHLRAMRTVPEFRAYAYWTALANAYNELDRRDEAHSTATTAAKFAASADQRAQAAQLAYIAETEVRVQFRRDANGRAQLTTTRVRREAPDFNPFIEPGDDLRRLAAVLEEIQCGDGETGIMLRSGTQRMMLTIADASRVLMKNAPEEFTCGVQTNTQVTVDYAAGPHGRSEGLVRGIAFRQSSPDGVVGIDTP